MKEKGSYKTLLKTDPEYKAYLLGSFSKNQVALPMESFGVGSERERTTFFILPSQQFHRPAWIKVYLKSIRPELLGLTLGHSLLAILSLQMLLMKHNSLSFSFVGERGLTIGLCLLATLFAHASACLFNDYQDHLNGTDRRSTTHGSRVIQRGWSRAIDVRRWAFVNGCLAFAIGVYLLYGNWLLLFGLSLVSGMAILFYSEMTPFWNKWGAGDFWITLLFGPLMFFSVWISILSAEHLLGSSQSLILDGLLLSLSIGLLASWTLQMRQFQDIFKREKGSFRTLISRLSFDQAKIFLELEGALIFLIQPLVFLFVWQEAISAAILAGGAVFAVLSLWGIKKIASPLSSQMLFLNKQALMVHGGFLGLWAGALWLL